MQEDDADSIAQAVRDGTYYEEARRWYSDLFHTPIAERSYYVIIIVLALITMFFALDSFIGIFPLATKIPFITYSDNVNEDLPLIRAIAHDKTEDKNAAVMKFLLISYLKARESYDLRLYELRYRSVWSQSTGAVFDQYKALMDTANPYSPYRLYVDRAHRVIDIDSLRYDNGPDGAHAHIVFEASVRSLADEQELSHARYQADIDYAYTAYVVAQRLKQDTWVVHIPWIAHLLRLTGNEVGDSGGKDGVTPMTFRVSGYQVKELLE